MRVKFNNQYNGPGDVSATYSIWRKDKWYH